MAERWGVKLTVGLAPEEKSDEDKAINHARNYLEMHEVEADYVVCEIDPISLVIDTAVEKEAQLIIAGGYSERRFGRRGPGNIVNRLVTEWQGALLICP
jgi:nucleotide-binding universal stress UspA family protein